MTARQGAGVAVFLLLLPLAGCYNPKIGEGDFVCGDNGACPSGFSCRAADNRCYKEGGGSTPGDAGADAGCLGPLPCSPATAPVAGCDPVCQTGCGCNEKCTNLSEGNICKPVRATMGAVYDRCVPEQKDDPCRPGLVCLGEVAEACGAHCYRFCRQDSDCGAMARCRAEAHDQMGNLLYKVCSPRIEMCNPMGPTPNCGVPGNAQRRWPLFACYMLSPDNPEESVCECAGSIPEGGACSREYSCAPGNECVKLDPSMPGRCRRLCTPDGALISPVACTLPQRCVAFPRTKVRGYCL